VSFQIDITYAVSDGAFLVLYGTVRAGSVCEGELISLPTAEGIELVDRIITMCTDDGLAWGRVWRPEQRFRLWVDPPYRADLIRHGLAESTTIRNNKLTEDWIAKTIAEKGADAIYAYPVD
jgi:hypothetical protein